MLKESKYSLVIIGSGPAALTAAIYAGRSNLNPIVISGVNPGGQLTTTDCVDNWPGEDSGINGSLLMNNMKNQAIRFNATILDDHITSVLFKKKELYLYSRKRKYICKSIIIATGSSPKFLELNSEKKFLNHGISTCAICDGFFYKNKDVAVIGGGNTAIENVLHLSNFVKSVTIIHRSNTFKAEKYLIDKLMYKQRKLNNINIYYNYIVDVFIGDDNNNLCSISIVSNKNNNKKNIDVSGAFISIGSTPNSMIFKNYLDMHSNNYIKINGKLSEGFTKTNIPGVFAAGDVSDYVYKQAITSSAMGCMAAIDAEKYLENISII